MDSSDSRYTGAKRETLDSTRRGEGRRSDGPLLANEDLYYSPPFLFGFDKGAGLADIMPNPVYEFATPTDDDGSKPRHTSVPGHVDSSILTDELLKMSKTAEDKNFRSMGHPSDLPIEAHAQSRGIYGNYHTGHNPSQQTLMAEAGLRGAAASMRHHQGMNFGTRSLDDGRVVGPGNVNVRAPIPQPGLMPAFVPSYQTQFSPLSPTGSVASAMATMAGRSGTSPRSYNESLFSFRTSPQASLEQQMEKQRKRKESHNAVERRRRDHINDMIQRLALLVTANRLGPDHGIAQRLNKGEVLEMAVKRIVHVQQNLHTVYHRLRQIDPSFVPPPELCDLVESLLLTIPETGSVCTEPNPSSQQQRPQFTDSNPSALGVASLSQHHFSPNNGPQSNRD